MATPLVHVVCGYSGGDGGSDPSKQPLFKRPQWSETPAANTLSNNKAPISSDRPVFRVTVQQDTKFAFGAAPDLTSNYVLILAASAQPNDYYVEPGDKFMWATT